MNLKTKQKKFFLLTKKYYIILIVVCILLFISAAAGYKLFIQKPIYLYIKVKVNQGLWWAMTEKPPFWYTQAIQKGDTAYNFLGTPEAKILDKKTFLRSDNDTYDIYVTMKIKVTMQNDSYIYQRSNISAGSPLEIQFPKEVVSGTVIAISNHMFRQTTVEKIIYLQKQNASSWEYDDIHVGDSVTDGTNKILTIVDKNVENTNQLTVDPNGTGLLTSPKNQGTITIKAKVALQKTEDGYVLGEEKVVKPGRVLNLSLSSYSLNDYLVSKIE